MATTRMTRWIAGAAAGALALGATAAAGAGKPSPALVKRGALLVKFGGCNDCHTPLKMGPQGPVPDAERLLSGHPQSAQLPPAPALPKGPWMAVVSATMTAWSGPWGTTYTANLTPDADTGLGRWTADTFIQAMRTGKHMGRGRPILPPMPVASVAALSDADLRAVFAYLQSIPAVKNRVPEPLPPAEVEAQEP